MEFDPTISFDENLTLFRREAEKLDSECARILFENLETLLQSGDTARNRQAVQEFHRAVLAALDVLPETPIT